MDDRAIIQLFQSRDEAAISAVREKYGAYCGSVALGITGDEQDAEECVSDALYRLWDSIPPAEPKSLRAFAGRITRNISINRLRDASRQKRGGGEPLAALDELASCVSAGRTPERIVEDAELTVCLDRWLASLPSEQRVAFVRRYWYLDSIDALSIRMGWSKSKTTSLLARLRASLRERLDSEGIEI